MVNNEPTMGWLSYLLICVFTLGDIIICHFLSIQNKTQATEGAICEIIIKSSYLERKLLINIKTYNFVKKRTRKLILEITSSLHYKMVKKDSSRYP